MFRLFNRRGKYDAGGENNYDDGFSWDEIEYDEDEPDEDEPEEDEYYESEYDGDESEEDEYYESEYDDDGLGEDEYYEASDKALNGHLPAGLWNKFIGMNSFDRIVAVTGAAVLALAVVTAGVYIS
ncbi:MAG: hypothetical protein LUG83_10150, partial [Lachnospiraceae bacterium]|nr:hypothetical protein [Lachnospiraceae bacterium]